MKKSLFLGLILASMSLVACGGGGSGTNSKTHTVTFDSNGGSPVPSQTVEHKGLATEPETPTKSDPVKGNYTFVEWRNGESTWSFKKSKVTKDITLTAKWLERYLVTYKNADDSEISSNYVDRNSALTAPSAPTAPSGKVFLGWMNTENGGQIWDYENADLNKVMDNTTLKPVFVDQGVNPQVFEAELCRDITEFAIADDDNDGVQDVDDQGNPKWVPMDGATYSGGAKGKQLIQPDFYVNGKSEMGASGEYTTSNGKTAAAFVHYMYAQNDTLTWKLVSSAAASNVTLIMRLSAEYGIPNEENEVTSWVDQDTFPITVNGTKLQYGKVTLHNIVPMEFIPFQDYFVSATVSLIEGENTIQMKVDNAVSLNGTIASSAPCVDCIKLYSSSTLTWPDAKMEQVASL